MLLDELLAVLLCRVGVRPQEAVIALGLGLRARTATLVSRAIGQWYPRLEVIGVQVLDGGVVVDCLGDRRSFGGFRASISGDLLSSILLRERDHGNKLIDRKEEDVAMIKQDAMTDF